MTEKIFCVFTGKSTLTAIKTPTLTEIKKPKCNDYNLRCCCTFLLWIFEF